MSVGAKSDAARRAPGVGVSHSSPADNSDTAPSVNLGRPDQQNQSVPDNEVDDVIERPEPLALADHFLDQRFRDCDGQLHLRRWRGDFYQFNGACFQRFSDEELDAAIYRHLSALWTIRRGASGAPAMNEHGRPIRLKVVPKSGLVREVRLALPSRDVLISGQLEAPAWLDGRSDPDPTNLIACSNGLLNIGARDLSKANPLLFNLNSVSIAFDPKDREPRKWIDFLQELWPNDDEAVATLQELFGYYLTHDTRQQKILLLVGPKRSGKGTIARILVGLLGSANVAAPSLGSLGRDFGLQPLLGKQLALVSDARLSGRTDQAVVVERLLAISGEDPVTVDRKFRSPLTIKLQARFMILSNELPRLLDTSGAIASRFVVLMLKRSWYGHEDPDLTDRLMVELPSILNWSIDGLNRLQERGHFLQPHSSTSAIQELQDLGSPIAVFLRERCVVAAGQSSKCRALFAEWRAWSAEQGRANAGTQQTFGRDLRTTVPGLRTTQKTSGDERYRAYLGIGLLKDPDRESPVTQ